MHTSRESPIPLGLNSKSGWVLGTDLVSRLQEKKALEWRDQVEILFGDMRQIYVPAQADILVSELLGSFGDNELSPECLDGAMRFMKRKSDSSTSEGMAPTLV